MILVNNQLDAQFFMYVYFYSLHFSGSHVSIIRRNTVSMQHLVYVTLCRWLSGLQVNLHTRRSSTFLVCRLICIVDGHLQSDINQILHWNNNSPDDGNMAAWNMKWIEINIHEKLCVKLVIYKDQHNLFNLTLSIIVGFSTLPSISLLINILQFSFSLQYGLKFF